jgi:hypothetical protein
MNSEAAVKFIRLDAAKLEQMQPKLCIPDVEEPIVALQVELDLKCNDHYGAGYLLLTRICLYLFKLKMFGAFDLALKLNLYRFLTATITVNPSDAVIECRDTPPIKVKTTSIVNVVYSLNWLLCDTFFGLREVQKCQIVSQLPLPPVNVKQRTARALKWRSLILAEQRDLKAGQLQEVDYFAKWEDKVPPLLVIGRSFHPSNLAPALGHAIAWESAIDSVCFQGFSSAKFSVFFEELLAHAVSISRIIFSDYQSKRIPPLGTWNTPQATITNWWFVRCCPDLILRWLESSGSLPEGSIGTLVLIDIVFGQEQQLAGILNAIKASRPAQAMHRLEIARPVIKPFPIAQTTRLLTICQELESIAIRGVDADGSALLVSIVKAAPKLRQIVLLQIEFRVPIEQVELPDSLLHLRVSRCAFTTAALISLFTVVTLRPRRVPIVLDAAELIMKTTCYAALSQLNFSACHSNIAEFDWSGNAFAGDPCLFFAFLFTQRRLRLLSLRRVSSDDPMRLLKLLMRLGVHLPLFGLDFSADFEPGLLAQFLQALCAWPSLHRLDVSGCAAGDAGLVGLADAFPDLPDLCEIGADGFRPKMKESLVSLWTAIAARENRRMRSARR